MIKATHNPVLYPLFCCYINRMLKRHFHPIDFIGEWTEDHRPVLLISNHISWWDGCWNLYFTHNILKRKYYFMAGEQQLAQHPFMKRVGGFGIRPGSKDILKSLKYIVSLLQTPAHAVLVYPQGKIASVYQTDIQFKKGVDYVVNHLEHPVQVVLIAYFSETGKEKKAGVWGYFKTWERQPETSIQNAYRFFYEESLAAHIKKLSE